uniref:Uncharacterized protein n=1 Tax=Anguilla anguilla TaxID=7936 RepID=A0A0E9XEA5_ANGAN
MIISSPFCSPSLSIFFKNILYVFRNLCKLCLSAVHQH